MATLIYSPAVAIVIESSVAGLVDVSADASVGNVVLRENGSHTVNFTLENPRRKYDGLFAPNDRIVVQMKRFNWLQIMSGYVDSAPYFSAYARKVNMSAQCPLKVLKFWPWDRGSNAAQNLMFSARNNNAQDGGMSEVVTKLLTNVANWPASRIHIGQVPSSWYTKAQMIFNRLDSETKAANDPVLGINPIIAGTAGVGTTQEGQPSVKESYPLNSADSEIVLAALRKVASGDDYTKVSSNGKTGAYQITDALWNNYGGYSRASKAPAAKQDEFAAERVRQISTTYGALLVKVPLAWFSPEALDDPSLMDKPMVAGSTMPTAATPRSWAYSWIDQFLSLYQQKRGHAFVTASTSSANIFYPIPPKTQWLRREQMAWGGFKNGEIPMYPFGDKRNPMAYSGACRWGHPIAVEAFTAMYLEAQKYGFDIRGGCYRDAATQRKFKVRDLLAAQGYSIQNAPADKKAAAEKEAAEWEPVSSHGWGLAVDIGVLSYGDSSKYKHSEGWDRAKMYTTPEYAWLKANAHRWGFSQVESNMQGAPNGEAWHWDFFGIASYDLKTNKRKDETVTTGYNPFTDSETAGLSSLGAPTGDQLYSIIAAWTQDPEQVNIMSNQLYGHRALLNDESLLDTVAPLIRASGRSYCSAPNGDFIAWWPDYWGEYGLAGALDVETIELQDFAVEWMDAAMITHQYVEGAYLQGDGAAMGPMPHGVMDALQAYYTRGVATVEMPGLLASLLNVPSAAAYPWLRDPRLLLQRFGARVDRKQNSMIYGAAAEFFAAVANLTRAWADQFRTTVPLTFMPELFPGMLLRIPYFGVQMYVSTVTHSWDYSNGAGFSTDAQTMAVSATDGSGFFIFPRGGDLISPPSDPRPTRGPW